MAKTKPIIDPVFVIDKRATSCQLKDELTTRLKRLSSMLALTYGDEEEEGFNSYTLEVRDSHLWSCAILANECICLSERLEVQNHG
jgi:hypothetical protein